MALGDLQAVAAGEIAFLGAMDGTVGRSMMTFKLGVSLVLAASNSGLKMPIFAGYAASIISQFNDIEQNIPLIWLAVHGLKIRVSMVRFRPWPPISRQGLDKNPSPVLFFRSPAILLPASDRAYPDERANLPAARSVLGGPARPCYQLFRKPDLGSSIGIELYFC